MSTAPPTAARVAPTALAIAVALVLLYVLWGSTYLAIRFALEGYPPFLLGAIRMSLAGALMYVVPRGGSGARWRCCRSGWCCCRTGW